MSDEKLPICPRCESDTTKIMFKSPVKDVWVLYSCQTCLFTWRSTEPETITNPKLYPKKFKIKPEDLKNCPVMPAIAE